MAKRAANNQAIKNTEPAPESKVRFKYSSFSQPANSRVQVKMPEPFRDYWLAEARQEKQSLSSVIIDLLAARYGYPPE